MGKKRAKLLEGKFNYLHGSYYGVYNGYDITIRYDYTSMLYNIYLRYNISHLSYFLKY